MMRILIVDDEAPARRKIRALLEQEADVQVVGEAAGGDQAVDLIRGESPDVVFLDIQMPRLDGFGVIQKVGVEAMPLVVFVTAYDEHALRAFEVNALDYLLKPFAAGRFQGVLERVRRRLKAREPGRLVDRLDRLLEAVDRSVRPPGQFLVERSPGREVLLPAQKIDRIRSEKNYVRLFSSDGEYLRRGTLRDFEERLDPERFLRINRSEIVRLEAVSEFQPWFHGDYRVVLHDGTVLTWSRRYRARRKGSF